MKFLNTTNDLWYGAKLMGCMKCFPVGRIGSHGIVENMC